MKQRVTIEIAGTVLHLLTDEPEEYVQQLAHLLDARMLQLSDGGRYSKLETMMLIAMDLLDGHVKDTARRKELEEQLAQIQEETACTPQADGENENEV